MYTGYHSWLSTNDVGVWHVAALDDHLGTILLHQTTDYSQMRHVAFGSRH